MFARKRSRISVRAIAGLALSAVALICSVPAKAAGLLIADGGFGGVLEI